MKFKVTVELEEGVKCTVTRTITTEAVLLKLKPLVPGDDVSLNELRAKLHDEAACGGARAMKGILNFLEKNHILLSAEKDGEVKFHKVGDISEAYKWLASNTAPVPVPETATELKPLDEKE
jgi:hypothetical protein